MAVQPPPIPPTWQTGRHRDLPAPLVGSGLGLFGLREPPFVDRDRARDDIWAALRRVVDQGGVESVWLAGPAGAGKSRLAEWLATRADEVGAARLLRVRHTDSGGLEEGLSAMVERTFHTWKLDRREVFERLKTQLPPLEETDAPVAEDARALTEFLRPTDPEADDVSGPRYHFSSARQVYALLERLLGRLSRRRPVILWLDDLQWGDQTVGLLEYLLETAPPRPDGLILATVRTDILGERPTLASRIEALKEEDYSHWLPLSPLSRTDQRQLLEGLLPLAAPLAERLARRTEGHPLFAMQLLGHWIDRGAIEMGPDGFDVPTDGMPELPDDIHHLWTERIDRLLEDYPGESQAVARALEVAAILGREVDDEEWRTILALGGVPQPPADLVDELIERGLARQTDPHWSFAHGLLVESLTRTAAAAGRLQQTHRFCAHGLADLLDETNPAAHERIAHHWIEADDPERALSPLLSGAGLRAKLGQHDHVNRLLDQRQELLEELEIPREDERWFEQEIARARSLKADGTPQELGEIAARVADRSRRVEDWYWNSRAQSMLALAARLCHEQEPAREHARRAIEAAERIDRPDAMAAAREKLAWVHYLNGQLEEADAQARASVAASERTGDDHKRNESQILLAHILHAVGSPQAGELLESVRQSAADAGYRAQEGRALNGLGEVARGEGRYEEARRAYQQYLQIANRLGIGYDRSHAKLNLAMTELQAGRVERAAQICRESRDELDAAGRHVQLILQLLRLGIAAGRGDWTEFDAIWESFAGDFTGSLARQRDFPILLEVAGDYASSHGRPDRARRCWELALEHWRALGTPDAIERLEERLN